MEHSAIARIKSACIDTAVFVACLAVTLGLVGALIVQPEPELEPYWHASSLLVIVVTAVLRSTSLVRQAWKEVAEAE